MNESIYFIIIFSVFGTFIGYVCKTHFCVDNQDVHIQSLEEDLDNIELRQDNFERNTIETLRNFQGVERVVAIPVNELRNEITNEATNIEVYDE